MSLPSRVLLNPRFTFPLSSLSRSAADAGAGPFLLNLLPRHPDPSRPSNASRPSQVPARILYASDREHVRPSDDLPECHERTSSLHFHLFIYLCPFVFLSLRTVLNLALSSFNLSLRSNSPKHCPPSFLPPPPPTIPPTLSRPPLTSLPPQPRSPKPFKPINSSFSVSPPRSPSWTRRSRPSRTSSACSGASGAGVEGA
jgi:hypothetical protein